MIDVKNFFRFIVNKNPKYSGKESVKSLYNGFIIPMDGESTIDEENLTLNGRFGNVNIHNYKNNVWHIREFVDGEIKSYYVRKKYDWCPQEQWSGPKWKLSLPHHNKLPNKNNWKSCVS